MPESGPGEGGNRLHWYTNPQTKRSQPVPRHAEINEYLAKSIIKKLSDD
jgi:mRNA interferase HicA